MALAEYTQVIHAAVLTATAPKVARFSDFSTNFTDEKIGRNRPTIEVPLVTGSTVTKGTTSWGAGDTASAMKEVVTDIFTAPFSITPAQYENGYAIADLVAANAVKLVDALQADFFANLAVAKGFAKYATAIDPATFTAADLQGVWASLAGANKNLLLNAPLFSKLLSNQTTTIDPESGAPLMGFKRVSYADIWTGAETKVVGAVCNPNALLAASGLPAFPEKVTAQLEQIQVPLGNGLTALLSIGYDMATRSDVASLDIMFGSAVGEASALKLLATA